MKRNRKQLIISIILLILSIAYTISVKYIDVENIGPSNSKVGFSRMNSIVNLYLHPNMTWYDITGVLGFIPFLLVFYYGIIGLRQLIKEKSILKVDKKILALGTLYIVLGIIYIFFEKCVINYRPVLIKGALEASYPSSHTLLAISVFGSSLLISKYYMKNEKRRKIIDIISVILMITIVVGRIISGVHWASDILGGMIISALLLSIFKTAILYIKE